MNTLDFKTSYVTVNQKVVNGKILKGKTFQNILCYG